MIGVSPSSKKSLYCACASNVFVGAVSLPVTVSSSSYHSDRNGVIQKQQNSPIFPLSKIGDVGNERGFHAESSGSYPITGELFC